MTSGTEEERSKEEMGTEEKREKWQKWGEKMLGEDFTPAITGCLYSAHTYLGAPLCAHTHSHRLPA